MQDQAGSYELLSPGGSIKSIKNAIFAGADAVYVGGTNYSARANANNLSDNDIKEIIDFLHLRGKKLYLAINTLIKEKELKSFFKYACDMYEAGVDAFIVQDFGVLNLLSKYLPDIEIHASTQMAVGGSCAINFLSENYNVRRVVLPRELSLNQIKSISDNTDVTLECFAHGALCYSYSGQCLMSSVICGRSGNRGRCAQSCRLPYSYENSASEYPLSLKELSSILYLPLMLSSGISSFKLEGRMRSPAYVGAITSIYKKYLDKSITLLKKYSPDIAMSKYFIEKSDKESIDRIFNRSGFTSGYLNNRINKKMISFVSSSAKSDEEPANEVFEKNKIDDCINVNADMYLSENEKARLSLSLNINDKEIRVIVYSDDEIEAAKNKALDYDTLFKQIKKSDDKYLVLLNFDLELKNDVFMPISAINKLRRSAFLELKKKIISSYGYCDRKADIVFNNDIAIKKDSKTNESTISVSIQNLKVIDYIIDRDYINNIYIEKDCIGDLSDRNNFDKLNCIADKIHKEGKKIYLALPHVLEENDYFIEEMNTIDNIGIDGYLVRNLNTFAILKSMKTSKKIILDYLLYAMNSQAVDFLLFNGVDFITTSIELNYNEIKRLIDFLPEGAAECFEMLVYGYPVAMISKQCLKRNHDACDKKSSFTSLTDRKNYKFLTRSFCSDCYNVIYNSQRIYLIDLIKNKLKDLKIKRYRFDFTSESITETLEILDSAYSCLSRNNECKPKFEYSRGHINRGIE